MGSCEEADHAWGLSGPGGQGGLWMNSIVTLTREAKDLNPCQLSMVPGFNPDHHLALTSHSRVNTCPPTMRQFQLPNPLRPDSVFLCSRGHFLSLSATVKGFDALFSVSRPFLHD
ncbi:unnamed protein product [Pleuronectes platessa]|uniref:Uncharacterized protein n=1 Tax=Pleuronectes platessa TaxID=8262 RepID=A0A9N7THQ4_PLEPL|nr:unnamed protein product [Pleuronectes platessa]